MGHRHSRYRQQQSLQLPSPALVSAPEQQQIQPNQIINNPLALSSNTNNVNGLNTTDDIHRIAEYVTDIRNITIAIFVIVIVVVLYRLVRKCIRYHRGKNLNQRQLLMPMECGSDSDLRKVVILPTDKVGPAIIDKIRSDVNATEEKMQMASIDDEKEASSIVVEPIVSCVEQAQPIPLQSPSLHQYPHQSQFRSLLGLLGYSSA